VITADYLRKIEYEGYLANLKDLTDERRAVRDKIAKKIAKKVKTERTFPAKCR